MVYSNLINSPLIDQILPKKMEQEKKIKRQIANCNERRRMQSINAGFNSLRTMLPKHDNEKLSKAAILQHTAEYIDQLEQDKTRFLQEIRTIKKLLNPELLEQYQKNQSKETELKLIEQQPFKRIKLEVNSLDLSNSESSDEGIICNSSPKQDNQPIVQQQILNNNKLDLNENQVTLINNQQTTQLINNNLIVKTTNDVIESSDNIDVLRAELVEVRKVLDKERKLRMKLEEQVRALEAQLYPTKIKEIAQQVQSQFQTTTSNPLTNQYAQIQFQTNKDLETEAAVTSVIVDQLNQNDIIAETVEIETQDCTDYLVNANTINLLTTNNQQTNTVSTLNLISQPDSLTNSSSSNKNLLDQTNLNQNKEKSLNDIPNKILTSTAYLTATTNINSSNKTQQQQFKIPSKSTSSNQKSDKNFQNKQKQIKNTSSNLSTQNSQLNLSSSIDQTSELNNKEDKLPASSAACIALPLFSNLPIIYDKSIEINSDTLSKLDQSSIIESSIAPNTVTIQIIDNNLIATSSIDNITSTTNNITLTNSDNSTTATSNRNNNLHTIVEAIKHLEGDRFYDNQNLIKQDKQENFLIVTADQLINKNHDLNSGILIETIKSNLNTSNSRQGVIVSSANH